MNASRHTPALLALCLLFAASAAAAGTREPRMHGPGGDGGECTATDATPADTDATADAPAGTATRPSAATAPKPVVSAPARIKPVVTVRGGGDDTGSVHAPRWHSFLPGMFR
jgi:hypothetical protein